MWVGRSVGTVVVRCRSVEQWMYCYSNCQLIRRLLTTRKPHKQRLFLIRSDFFHDLSPFVPSRHDLAFEPKKNAAASVRLHVACSELEM